MRTIEVPDELLDLLKGSRLAERSEADQVKSALAIRLFREGLISIGKAAALAGVPRLEFEWLLIEMGIPVIRYDPVQLFDLAPQLQLQFEPELAELDRAIAADMVKSVLTEADVLPADAIGDFDIIYVQRGAVYAGECKAGSHLNDKDIERAAP
jgi:predicted HTH domain antitoxin